ncbi:MAG: universal stress protein [Nitrososphaerota archaeon]|nr:universal stress protein [Nitrososphaerota archaeon]
MKSKRVEPLFPIKKIIVPVDGSENSSRAADVAIRIAKEQGAALEVLHVVTISGLVSSPVGVGTPSLDLESYYDTSEKEGRKIVDLVVTHAKKAGVEARGEVLRSVSSPAYTITENAKGENADLIVIGTRGLGGFRRLLLGSVSNGVVTHAHCAVLVVR